MGINDVVMDRLGGKQVKQMVDLVDDLWGERKKIIKVVDLVWDNRDEIMGVVKFVGDNKDKIDDVVRRLPMLIGQAGQGLEAAGVGAARASALLLGDDGDGPQQLTDEAADLLERCQQQLFEVTTMIGEVGEGLSFIKLPNRLDDGAQRLIDVADDLGGVAVRFRDLGVQLADAGLDMADVGSKLGSSGSTLQSFVSESPKPRRKTAAPSSRSSKSSRSTKSSDGGIWGGAAAKVLAEKQRQVAAEKAAERRRVAKRAADRKRAAKKIADAAKEASRRRDAATASSPGERSTGKRRTAPTRKPAAKRPAPRKPASRSRQKGGGIGPTTMKPINKR